jgi:ribosomal protein S8
MYIFCNHINNALNQNFSFVDIKFKKKYIYILNELLRLNLIKFFNFNKKNIRVYFRYFKNKSIFSLDCKITQGQKHFLSYKRINNLYNNQNDNSIRIFSSSNNSFCEKNILYLNQVGGLYILKINILLL